MTVCAALTLVVGLQISGTFKVDGSGNVDFVEEDGIDYAAVTVQLPGGERVPFLFTIKELQVRRASTGTSARCILSVCSLRTLQSSVISS